MNVKAFEKQFIRKGPITLVALGGLGCFLNRCGKQRFFSSLVNEPRQSRWAAIDEARSGFSMPLPYAFYRGEL